MSRVEFSIKVREGVALFVVVSIALQKSVSPDQVQSSWRQFFIYVVVIVVFLLLHRFVLKKRMDRESALFVAVGLDTVGACYTIGVIGDAFSPYLVLIPLLASTWTVVARTGKYAYSATVLSGVFLALWAAYVQRMPTFQSVAGAAVVTAVTVALIMGLVPLVKEFERRTEHLIELAQKLRVEKRELEKYAEEVLDLTSKVEFEKELSERQLRKFQILFSLSRSVQRISQDSEEKKIETFIQSFASQAPVEVGVGKWKIGEHHGKVFFTVGEREEKEAIFEMVESFVDATTAPLSRSDTMVCTIQSLGDGDEVKIGIRFSSAFFAQYYDEILFDAVKLLALELLRLKYTRALHRLSITDGLTGLYNHRYFYQRLEEERERCFRMGVPLSLLMIDFDHFKKVNDRYGHLIGDELLKKAAKRLQRICRRTDILCRYGGEEFSVILPGTSLEGATTLAEKIRRAFEEPMEDLPENPVVTVSIGVSTIHEVERDVTLLVKRADEALLMAKRAGRNRVEVIP